MILRVWTNRLIGAFFLCFGVSEQGKAQSDAFIVKYLTTAEQLSNNTVYCILQDHIGFIWAGTEDGLNRFDGKMNKVFRNDPMDSSSISNNMVRCILEDKNHVIWLGTRGGGLNRYDRDHDSFKSFQYLPNDSNSISNQEIATLFQDSKGNLWIGTDGGGLNRYVPEKGNFVRYNKILPREGGLSSLKIISISEDESGNLLLGTWDAGLNIFNPETGRSTVIRKGSQGLTGDNIWTIKPHSKTLFWMGLFAKGLQYFNSSGTVFKTLVFPDKILEPTVYSIIFEGINEVWLGTNVGLMHGTYSIHEENVALNQDFIRVVPQITTYLRMDEEGSIWAATVDNGLIHVWKKDRAFLSHDLESRDLPVYSQNLKLNAFAESSNGIIWLATNNGLLQYNPKNDLSRFVNDHEALKRVYDVSVDRTGSLLVGRNSDLSKWNMNTGRLEPYYQIPKEQYPLIQAEYSSLLEGDKNDLWIGTGNGLYHYDLRIKQTRSIIPPGTVFHGQSIYQIRAVKLSADTIYAATRNGGLVVKYAGSDSLKIFQHSQSKSNSIASNKTNNLLISKDGSVWISTYNGLDKFEKNTATFTHFSTQEGFPSKILYSILEDNSGYLWISNPNGISRFNPENKEVVNFYFFDPTIHNSFFANSAFKSRDGRMYFGKRASFVTFYPDSIHPYRKNLRLLITDFVINSKKSKVNFREYIQRRGDSIQLIRLPYDLSSFSFDYTSLNFRATDRNIYYYKLEPFEKEWVFAGNSTTVNYTNIPPGKYVFKVKSIFQEGFVTEKTTSVQVIILPPFWLTWWFQSTVILLILGLVYLAYTMRVLSLKKEKTRLEFQVKERTSELSSLNMILEEQKEELVSSQTELSKHRDHLELLVGERTAELESAKMKAEESDRLKSAFLANMSHEIRTPLNAIVGFSCLLSEENLTKEILQEFREIIDSNSAALLVLIDDIIDLSRIEAEQLRLVFTDFEPVEVLHEIFAEKNFPGTSTVEFRLGRLSDHIHIYSDKIRFRQIVNNLVSNGMKYSENGFVEAGISVIEKDKIVFYVKDTGIGISPENQKVIFDRFRKIEDTPDKLYRGAGLGLAITKRLVELSGGEIWLESKQGEGSTFYFSQHLSDAGKNFTEPEIGRSQGKITKNLKAQVIAIAEDDKDNYLLLKAFLDRLEIKTIWFKNGKDIANYFQTTDHSDVSLVLMDIKMPVMDGYEATRIIRKRFPSLPIIAQTAHAMVSDTLKLQAAGFDAILTKPINMSKLMEIILHKL